MSFIRVSRNKNGLERLLNRNSISSRYAKAESRVAELAADASWAATHRSELTDLRDAFAKAEAENATLKAQLAVLSQPVTDEEEGWANTYSIAYGFRGALKNFIASRIERSKNASKENSAAG